MHDKTLSVFINAWNSQVLRITFTNTLGSIHKIGSFITGVYEKKEPTLFLEELISLYYEQPPKNHKFKTFIIVDIEDNVFFEIVAEQATVLKL